MRNRLQRPKVRWMVKEKRLVFFHRGKNTKNKKVMLKILIQWTAPWHVALQYFNQKFCSFLPSLLSCGGLAVMLLPLLGCLGSLWHILHKWHLPPDPLHHALTKFGFCLWVIFIPLFTDPITPVPLEQAEAQSSPALSGSKPQTTVWLPTAPSLCVTSGSSASCSDQFCSYRKLFCQRKGAAACLVKVLCNSYQLKICFSSFGEPGLIAVWHCKFPLGSIFWVTYYG